MTAKTKGEIFEFMRSCRQGVIATAGFDGKPEAALLDIAVTPELEIIFETTDATRKIRNLRNNSQVSFVIGWRNNQSLQYDGAVDEPSGHALERITQQYFSIFPEKLSHRDWPGNHYFRVRPSWIRISDYNSPRTVEEHHFALAEENRGAMSRKRQFSFSAWIGRLGNHFLPR